MLYDPEYLVMTPYQHIPNIHCQLTAQTYSNSLAYTTQHGYIRNTQWTTIPTFMSPYACTTLKSFQLLKSGAQPPSSIIMWLRPYIYCDSSNIVVEHSHKYLTIEHSHIYIALLSWRSHHEPRWTVCCWSARISCWWFRINSVSLNIFIDYESHTR